jgi:hypothetical protein
MVPAVADHRTATFGVFFTRAVNCRVSEDTIVEMSGVIWTATDELTAWLRQKLDTNVNASASSAYTRGECDFMKNIPPNCFRNTGESAKDPTAID